MPPRNSDLGRWFTEYLEPHESKLRSWLRGRYADENDIDDIVQESYLRVLRAKEGTEIRSPKTFLFTIARNVAVSHTRRKINSSSIPLAESVAPDDSAKCNLVPDIVARKQEYEILAHAISKLPKKCRQIFIMRKIDGLTQREIARELGISTNTVSAQLQIGIKKCADFFEQYQQGGSS